jgi:hypothetical protein
MSPTPSFVPLNPGSVLYVGQRQGMDSGDTPSEARVADRGWIVVENADDDVGRCHIRSSFQSYCDRRRRIRHSRIAFACGSAIFTDFASVFYS